MQSDDFEMAIPLGAQLSSDELLQHVAIQVSAIAARLDRLSAASGFAHQEQAPALCSACGTATCSSRLAEAPGHKSRRSTRPPLPDPRLIREIIRQRQLRVRFFDGELFADPVWDMLLDLTAERAEHTRVSVTSLCIASGIPATTALRWIGQMADAGLVERVEDEIDRRRAFIVLSDKAAAAMSRYFAEIGTSGVRLV